MKKEEVLASVGARVQDLERGQIRKALEAAAESNPFHHHHPAPTNYLVWDGNYNCYVIGTRDGCWRIDGGEIPDPVTLERAKEIQEEAQETVGESHHKEEYIFIVVA